MPQHKISYITKRERDVSLVEEGLEGLDYEMTVSLSASPGETIEAIRGADVVVNGGGVSMPREVIEEIDTAVAIVSVGQGFDTVDTAAATEKGVMVVNCAGYVTEHVSNHTMMLVLACARKLTITHDLVRSGGWTADSQRRAFDLHTIDGEVLGIVGLGNIGRSTARKAAAFGMNVIGYDPFIEPWLAHEYRIELVDELSQLASRADYVADLLPLNDQTRKLIGASFFRAMKSTAYFTNCGRGGTVDEAALVEALRDGEIAGAGIDVFEEEPTPPNNPLLKMDNVIVTPHLAGASVESSRAGMLRLGEETARILKGTWPLSLVNPEVRAKLPQRPPATNR